MNGQRSVTSPDLEQIGNDLRGREKRRKRVRSIARAPELSPISQNGHRTKALEALRNRRAQSGFDADNL